MGAAFIARLILALSDSFLLDLLATALVVETHNTKHETSNNLIAFIIKSPHYLFSLRLTPTALETMLLDRSSFLAGPTEFL
jgi:hypothetical protein